MTKAETQKSFTFGLALLSLWLCSSPSQAVRGCCSMHSGAAECEVSTDRLLCRDGTDSPSCSCSELSSVSAKALSKKAEPIIGKDIRVKDKTVNTSHLRPEIMQALQPLTQIWGDHGLDTPVITSGNDSIHPDKRKKGLDCSTEELCRQTSSSRHYQDLAVDVQSKTIPSKEEKLAVERQLKDQLASQGYYVKLENRGTSDEHFHIQYNPPTRSRAPKK